VANLDEILKKSQDKLKDKALQTKKVKRDSHTRPWREDGLEFGNTKVDTKIELSTKLADTSPEAFIAAPLSAAVSPVLDMSISKLNDPSESTTNLQQTTLKPTTVVQQNLRQTNNKPTSNIQQTYNRKIESYNDLTTQPTTVVQLKPTTVVQQNLRQTNNKPTSNIQQTYNGDFNVGINRLTGLNLALLRNIFEICLNEGSRITGPLNLETITNLSGIKNTKTTQTIIYRLEKQGYLFRNAFKAGRGGWTSYEIPTEIYNQLLQYNSKLTTNIQRNSQLTYNKYTSELTTQSTTTSPSKIDSIFNNTNYLTGEQDTNGTKSLSQSPAQSLSWFKDLDFSQIPIIRPMLVNSAIRKQVESELDRDDVQIFINKFKNWLASQHKIQNPVAIFCEKLKEWCNEGASDVLYALSDEEIEIEKVFALEVEKKRQELALIEKARTFKLEQDGELKFEAWFKSSTDDEKKELFKPQEFAEFGSAHYIAALKSVYLEQNG
jgi:hypothetical protein